MSAVPRPRRRIGEIANRIDDLTTSGGQTAQ
jgi:hypothetical protein